ncbi:MAG: hypothetical protein KKH44_01470 [Bacteroidetes bacterium]|nr:hypothetical protein [Bacteroidota bacterium]
MNDPFHAEISTEEFRYAIGIWSAAVAGKLHVPEILSIPVDAGPVLCMEFSVSDKKNIIIYILTR